MLNLNEVFAQLSMGLKQGDSRYVIESEYSVMDTKTGIKYHFHDPESGKPWEIYDSSGKVILTNNEMTESENDVLKSASIIVKHLWMDSLRDNFYNLWLESATQPETTTKM